MDRDSDKLIGIINANEQEWRKYLLGRFNKMEDKLDKLNGLRAKIMGGLVVIALILVPLVVEYLKRH